MEKHHIRAETYPAAEMGGTSRPGSRVPAMLNPTCAWKSLCARTGGRIARVTFYRWVKNGKVFSIRLGHRIFIPVTALEDVIQECLSGEEF